MPESVFGLFELLLVFGGVLALGFWELYSLRRDRLRAARKQAVANKLNSEKPNEH